MNDKKKRQSMILYAIIAIAAIVALQSVVYPSLERAQVREVSYSEFIDMVDDNKVDEVSLDTGSGKITFTSKGEENVTYRATMWPNDDTLSERLNKHNVTYSAQIADQNSGLWMYMLLVYGLPVLLAVIGGIWLNRRMKKMMGDDGPSMNFGGGGFGMGGGLGKSHAKEVKGTETGVKFADVAGQDEAKESLQEIVSFLKNPGKYTEIGARCPRGALLVGPPGTGKTLLARAVAGEANVQFLSISGSDFVELYVGIGASRVRDLFEQAKRSAPAIIFIDEIDAVGRRRGAGMGGGHDEREQTLNQLLVEMDGFGSNDGVIVMAATNRRDILDPALLRPGRFDRQIYVNVPDVGGREAILRVHARDKQLSDDVDLRTVARATAGFTGADLENLLNEAALISARKNLPVITMQTMEDAVLKVIAGPEKRSLVNIERDRRITAIHEAGHAVAAYFLSTQEPVHQITIVPRGNALGLTISLPDQDTLHTTRNEMRDRIVVLLGGRVAEQLEFDDISTGASNDLQRATKLAHDMIAKYGMNERIGAVAYDDDSEIFVGRDYERTRSYSEQTAAEIDAEVRKTVDQAYAHCTQILTEHHEKLQEIAQWLLEHETMSRSQFEACMQALPIPEKQESLLAGEEKTDGAEED